MKRDCRCPRARHTHGTRAGYTVDRCRCFACRVAYANSTRVYRNGGSWTDNRLTDSIGTKRRLQALAAIGIGSAIIAERIGITRDGVSKIRTCPGQVSVETAAKIAAVYDDLWDKPRNDGNAKKAIKHARRQGWLTPMAWDDDTIDKIHVTEHAHTDLDIVYVESIDEMAVEQAIAGRRVTLTPAEVSTVVDTMRDMGYSARETAERLGTSTRLVVRRRAASRKREAA